MARVPEPGQPGFNRMQFDGFALRVGLNLARKAGFGEELAAALASRFPTADGETISNVYGILQQGHFAAVEFQRQGITGLTQESIAPQLGLSAGEPNPPAINLDIVPVIPPTFSKELNNNRVVIVSDVNETDESGDLVDSRNTIIGTDEFADYEEILDNAIEEFYAGYKETPAGGIAGLAQSIINWVVRFIGKIF